MAQAGSTLEFLVSCGLSTYAHRLEEAGVDTMEFLFALTDAELSEAAVSVGMKPLHVKKLLAQRRAWKAGGFGSESHCSDSSAGGSAAAGLSPSRSSRRLLSDSAWRAPRDEASATQPLPPPPFESLMQAPVPPPAMRLPDEAWRRPGEATGLLQPRSVAQVVNPPAGTVTPGTSSGACATWGPTPSSSPLLPVQPSGVMSAPLQQIPRWSSSVCAGQPCAAPAMQFVGCHSQASSFAAPPQSSPAFAALPLAAMGGQPPQMMAPMGGATSMGGQPPQMMMNQDGQAFMPTNTQPVVWLPVPRLPAPGQALVVFSPPLSPVSMNDGCESNGYGSDVSPSPCTSFTSADGDFQPDQLEPDAFNAYAGRQMFLEAFNPSTLEEGGRPQALPPSEGSAFHGTNRCSPCGWFWKPQGCHHGQRCRFCHLCDEGEMKRRKKARSEGLRRAHKARDAQSLRDFAGSAAKR